MRFWTSFLAVAAITACSSTGGGSAIGTTSSTSSGRILQSGAVEIAECGTPGAPTAQISYPAGWSNRVSQAETEGELLGGAPTRVDTSFAPVATAMPDLQYPENALNPPIEARCEAKFDLSTGGETSNILVACSNPMFTTEMARIIRDSRFKPVRVNGNLARGVNLVFPLSFCLADY
ncbi:MAG: energy transducer TonB [Pseudomonadota bacterium]